MYTIFKNDTSIILTDNRNILSQENCFLWINYNKRDDLNKLISNSGPSLYLFNDDLELMWISFQRMYKIIEAGGGIVTNDKENILFIYRHEKWDLPKGKIEKNETKEDAAVREVEEECGLHEVELRSYHSTTYHIYEDRGEEILKISYWYKMYSEEIELHPQIEEGITDLAWIEKKEVPELLLNTYPNIILLMNMYTSDKQQ